MPRSALLLLLAATPCLAHDLSVDVSAMGTAGSPDNPRTGSLGLGVSGSIDFNESWSLTGMAVFTRDLPTRTAESASSGSNVLLFSLGAMWLPTDSLMTMLSVTVSPPVDQANATSVTGPLGRSLDVVILSRTYTLGAMWNGLWSSNGLSKLEHTIDVTLGFNHYGVFQRLAVPNSVRGDNLRQACTDASQLQICRLVRGLSSPLWQGRFGAGYTATLFIRTDLGLDGTYYLYDQPPTSVGYFSLVSLGRELGNGVPVLPLRLMLRPHIAHRFGKVTLKFTYQWGLYTEDLGALHALTARLSWKVTDAWRLSLSMTGQLDLTDGVAGNHGGQALLGVLYAW